MQAFGAQLSDTMNGMAWYREMVERWASKDWKDLLPTLNKDLGIYLSTLVTSILDTIQPSIAVVVDNHHMKGDILDIAKERAKRLGCTETIPSGVLIIPLRATKNKDGNEILDLSRPIHLDPYDLCKAQTYGPLEKLLETWPTSYDPLDGYFVDLKKIEIHP